MGCQWCLGFISITLFLVVGRKSAHNPFHLELCNIYLMIGSVLLVLFEHSIVGELFYIFEPSGLMITSLLSFLLLAQFIVHTKVPIWVGLVTYVLKRWVGLGICMLKRVWQKGGTKEQMHNTISSYVWASPITSLDWKIELIVYTKKEIWLCYDWTDLEYSRLCHSCAF